MQSDAADAATAEAAGGTDRAVDLLTGHGDQAAVAPLSLVAQGDLDPVELSPDEWAAGLRAADIAVELDHPAEKTAWVVCEADDGFVVHWSTGRTERGPGGKAALVMMAAASDCGLRVVHRDMVGDQPAATGGSA